MCAIEETLVRYHIDQRDHITYVSDEWDAVATVARSPHLHGSTIVGQPLWRFISDVGTSEIYRQILARVRRGPAVDLALRCDTPELRRTIGLEISARADGGVAFHSRVLSAEPRPHQAVLDVRTPRSDQLLHVCGWCKKFDVDGHWVEVEEAVAMLHLFEEAMCPRMSHGICDACLVGFTA